MGLLCFFVVCLIKFMMILLRVTYGTLRMFILERNLDIYIWLMYLSIVDVVLGVEMMFLGLILFL